MYECGPADHYSNYLGKMIKASDGGWDRRATGPIIAPLTCHNPQKPTQTYLKFNESDAILIQVL